ncbi:MAG: hypothetical protein JO097_17735 [Acidobacteriaceae bacterium]|nr:hypothetical protein [Acidobacteriaceae bacterium]
MIKKTLSPILFLMLTPVFYIWSIHSSGTPIFLPQLQSRGYYNSRYGIAVVALAAFAAGAIVLALPTAYKKWAALLPLLSLAPWLLHPTPGNWICWKESQVNSVSRRAWTNAGTDFFRNHYSPGEGILTPSASGDLAGIFCRKGIPLRDTINVGNGPAWFANTRPDLVHQALWAVSQAGDPLANALSHDQSQVYSIASEIQVKGAPPLQIYRRK